MKSWIEFKYWYISRPLENLWLKFIHILPRKLVYWCAIRLGAYATAGKYSNQIVPDLTFVDALKRWEEGN